MKRSGNREDSLRFGLSLFLILGSVAGSLFCNLMSEGMKKQLLELEGSMVSASALMKLDLFQLFFRVLRKRQSELFLLLLFSMTRTAVYCYLAVSLYIGFSVSVLISALTMQSGFRGIVDFAALTCPQAIIYGGIFYILVWWMQEQKKRITWLSAAAFSAAVGAGALVESLVGPWIAALLLT